MQEYVNQYLLAPLTEEEKIQIDQSKNQFIEEKAFDGFPSFGTGGMRAIVGHGTNRLNIYNIAKLNMAFAKVLKTQFNRPVVVMAYDSRISNTLFSKVSYHILKSFDIDVKIFKRPTPTPMLSFAVLELHASAGIVITASHNPPEYNGYKVYWDNGAQIIPPYDGDIENLFQEISYADIPKDIHSWIQTPPDEKDLIEEEIVTRYLAKIRKESFVSDQKKNISILYSPLHGTGGWIYERVFKELNFENFSILEEQKEPDGRFPTVKSPNPEDSVSFEMLIQKGKEKKAKLLLASDPDADRVGCALWSEEIQDYQFLTGNQIGALLLESAARAKAQELKNPFLCKTIVTTELQTRIASSYNIKTVETLTGFKYIAEVIEKDPDNYLFGGEESYGYLPIAWVRDKDSLSSSLALSELAEKNDLMKLLNSLYTKHGYYHEITKNIKLSADKPGLMEKISNKIENFSGILENFIEDRKVIDIISLVHSAKEACTEAGKIYRKSLPESKVLQYWLEPEGRITVRPSGTEPKIKIYISLRSREVPNLENLKKIQNETEIEAETILNIFANKLLEE